MVLDSVEPDHAEGENRKAAATAHFNPKDSHAGDKSLPSQEEVQTSEDVTEQKIPEVPETQKDDVQRTMTVSEETGEEEKEQVSMNEATESFEEEKKMADEQTDQQVEKKEEMKPELLVDKSPETVEITGPQSSLPEEAVTELGEVCMDDTGKTNDLVESEGETEIKKEDVQPEKVGEETGVDMPAEDEKKEDVEEKKLQEDAEKGTKEPKTEEDAKKSTQVQNEMESVTSTVVEDLPAETEKMVNESETSGDVSPLIIINGEKDELHHLPEKISETNHEQSASPEAATEVEVDRNRAMAVKPDIEKDSDSGSSSAADTNSIDMNLSISSFLSRSKEGSISVQVRLSQCALIDYTPLRKWLMFMRLYSSGCQIPKEDSEKDTQVYGGWGGGQCNHVEDSY